jgi:hypothetical protein
MSVGAARTGRPLLTSSLAVAASAAVGAGLGFGAPLLVLGALLAGVGVWCLRVLVRRGQETALLTLAGTAVAPLPDALRGVLMITAVVVVVGVAVADRVWPTAATRALSRSEFTVLMGLTTFYAALITSSLWPGNTSRPLFVLAAAISLVFAWALYHRAHVVGRRPIAAGIAAAAALAGLIVLLRVGGVPLLGSSTGASYVSAKDVVVGELGDANGQALVVMLGLPFLLAFALQATDRRALIAASLGTAIATLSLLVLLSRSSLVGAVVGAAVVTALMTRLSRRRVVALVLATAGAGLFFANGLEQLTSDQTNLLNRSVLWRTAVDFWQQRPLIGHGPDSWPRLIEEQVRWAPPDAQGGTHNVILSGLVSGGVITAALQVLLIGAVVYLGVRNLRRLRANGDLAEYAAVVGAVGAFSAQLVRGGFEVTGWPGTRANDIRTWSGLFLVAVVVIITASVRSRPAEPGTSGSRPHD